MTKVVTKSSCELKLLAKKFMSGTYLTATSCALELLTIMTRNYLIAGKCAWYC